MAAKTDVKTAPDTEALQMDLGPDPVRRKVELDLDDAPFLKSEEKMPAVAASQAAPAVPQDGAAPPKKRSWRLAGCWF